MAPAPATATATATDYEVEIAEIEADLVELTSLGGSIWNDVEAAIRLVFRTYHLASLTAEPSHLEDAASAIDVAIEHLGPGEDLCLLKANLDLKLHQVHRVRADILMAVALAQRPEGQALLADVDFQCGRYHEARIGYEEALRRDPVWDNMARLAHLEATFGNVGGADELYARAADELTAKEMRSYAWVETQRGGLDVRTGRYDEARDHYERAAAAYSGWWPVATALADLAAADGAQEEALGRYADLASRMARPEITHALGDLLSAAGRSDEGRACHGAALAIYLDSVAQGHVHYLHHLVDLYADALGDGALAVQWAERDVDLRPGFSTVAALAWALHRAGRSPEAAERMGAALATGVVDARMFAKAATIYGAAGRADRAAELAQRALEVNPRLQDLHADS